MTCPRTLLRAIPVTLMGFYTLYLASLTARAAAALLRVDPLGSSSFSVYAFRNSLDEPVRYGFGIAFFGALGLAWAIAQTLVIAVALSRYTLARDRSRTLAWLALVAVAALWFGNVVYFSVIGGFGFYWAILGAHAIGFAATLAARPRPPVAGPLSRSHADERPPAPTSPPAPSPRQPGAGSSAPGSGPPLS